MRIDYTNNGAVLCGNETIEQPIRKQTMERTIKQIIYGEFKVAQDLSSAVDYLDKFKTNDMLEDALYNSATIERIQRDLARLENVQLKYTIRHAMQYIDKLEEEKEE